MAVFFFAIGLETKRDIIAGKLSNLRKAMLPIVWAVGGIVLPTAFFLALHWCMDTSKGLGIPMATDIVFALVLLTMVGSTKAPITLTIFVTDLTVVDAILAIRVIALIHVNQNVLESIFWAFFSFFC